MFLTRLNIVVIDTHDTILMAAVSTKDIRLRMGIVGCLKKARDLGLYSGSAEYHPEHVAPLKVELVQEFCELVRNCDTVTKSSCERYIDRVYVTACMTRHDEHSVKIDHIVDSAFIFAKSVKPSGWF